MNIKTNERTFQILNKVPSVTIYFWIIKIMATTVGETAADFLSFNLHFGLSITSTLMSALLLIALVFQVRSKIYVAWIYWLVVVLISVVGTLITDNLVDNFGISLQTTTIVFTAALFVTFITWYLSEKTLSIQSIITRKRELFYWAVILFTFALGTAMGDLAAEGWKLGYAISILIFAGMIALVAITHYFFKVNAIIAFWVAYILTRPFGASFGDWLSQPTINGGLDLGSTVTSILFLVIIVALVAYLTKTERHLLQGKFKD